MQGKQPQTVEEQLSNLRRWVRTVTKEVQILTQKNKAAIDRLDRLNGSVDKIHSAADTIDQLVILAPQLARIAEQLNPEVVGTVLALASRQKEKDDWWEGTRHRLSPLKPVGAAFWLVASGLIVWIVGTFVVNDIGPALHPR